MRARGHIDALKRVSSRLGGPLPAVSGSVAALEALGTGDQGLDGDQVIQHRAVGGDRS